VLLDASLQSSDLVPRLEAAATASGSELLSRLRAAQAEARSSELSVQA
jgi:hypothetical protein